MSTETEKLKLFKWDTTNQSDLDSNFDIDKALNNNWDKIEKCSDEIDSKLSELENSKVNKIDGKQLSTNDFTNEYKEKLDGLNNYNDTELKNDINKNTEKIAQNTESIQTNRTDIDKILSEYITKAVNDLQNYYLKEEIDEKISSIPKFSIEVVETLPTENISTTTIYLVLTGEETDNIYTEYIYTDKWEKLGTQKTEFAIRINYFNKNSSEVVKDHWKGTGIGGSIEGEGAESQNYFMTNVIKCNPGDKIRFNYPGYNRNIMFADSQKIIIQNIFSEDYMTGITAPDNAYYFRVLQTYNSSTTGTYDEMLDKLMITINREIPDKYYNYENFEEPNQIIEIKDVNNLENELDNLENKLDNLPINTVVPDGTVFNDLPSGVVLFTMDGIDNETYDAIMPYANNLGIPITCFSGAYDNTLLSKIHNDNYNNCYGIYTSQPKATFEGTTNYIEQYDQLKNQYDNFLKNGLGKPQFAAYASGAHTSITENVLKKFGIKLARTTEAGTIASATQDMFNLKSTMLNNSNAVAQVESTLQWNYSKIWVITVHAIASETKTDSYYLTEANMKSVLDTIKNYMNTKNVTVMNLKQFWEYMTFPHNSQIGVEIVKKESDNEYHKYFKGSNGWIEL